MAGSYKHAVSDDGQLLRNEDFPKMIENLGDAYETIEEMYGMIWYLSGGDAEQVELARRAYRRGLDVSPGTDGRVDYA